MQEWSRRNIIREQIEEKPPLAIIQKSYVVYIVVKTR